VDDFIARLDLKGALEIYLLLEEREDELGGASAKLLSSLRTYLYDNLSIEDMESPRSLLETL
jgi:hypothetical protein